ncbi:hypothetical protein EJ02DRAFT_455142 [Clathrospora elynae]|uniref:Saccharopine dehydrogenase NADP binding domain-containing protein n=1 Tax=Clathrospora elynae TaxID=706981 RepID=A0A6A5SPQ3_9PLEO|nr:hypothetical protein EJ02DRAFT_455142 [Clathrospora elynae]
MADFMIYGAGYTGGLTCDYAKSIGLKFVLAGRNASKVNNLASTLQVQGRTFRVEDSVAVKAALTGIRVLLNCAGPFSGTVRPLVEACIQHGVHYLDNSAELESYRFVQERDEDAVRANVMLMPGSGASVAMLGCLVGRALEDLDSARSIDVALHVAGSMSRGSAISAAENITTECLQRLSGELAPLDASFTKNFDFDNGNSEVSCFSITLPDLITIWKSNGIPNIRTFAHVSEGVFPSGDLLSLPDGPTAGEREGNPYHAAVAVTAADGTVKRAVLHTVNGYTFTAVASVEAAKRVLSGQTLPGFQTPVIVFGSGFVETIAGSRIQVQ